MRTAITTTQLSKHYPGIVALDDVTLDIPEGSVYGFLGPNGAGKSTLIKILAGLTRPTGGSAVIGGIPLANGSPHRRQIGYLGQEPRFYDWMTGRETLRYVAGFHPWITDPVERRIDEALRLTGIADAGSRRTGTYSGGMRQRLGIAQALIGRPQVLLLDEPASALDPAGRRDVLDLMGELRGAATIFYSTHILDDVQRVSDHVAILDEGRLVVAAPTDKLLASFSRDRIRVVLRGASEATMGDLAALPAVASVELVDHGQTMATYLVAVRTGATEAAQASIARWAVASDLTLISNAPEQTNLEDVFLGLISGKEQAA